MYTGTYMKQTCIFSQFNKVDFVIKANNFLNVKLFNVLHSSNKEAQLSLLLFYKS